jgi:hypothetical protein
MRGRGLRRGRDMGLARRMRDMLAQDSTEKRRYFLHRTAENHRFRVRVSD